MRKMKMKMKMRCETKAERNARKAPMWVRQHMEIEGYAARHGIPAGMAHH